jgi:hypothetical protein
MLRYRISRDENGHYFVLPAFLGVFRIADTCATRDAAQDTADWLNKLRIEEALETGTPVFGSSQVARVLAS